MHPLHQWSANATPEAVAQIRLLAEALHVSQGSVVDTALRELLKRSPEQVAELLFAHKHLTEEEFEVVREILGQARQKSKRRP